MTSPGLLILALVVAIAVILFCIIVLKLNAAIGMVIACLVMGVMGGLDLLTTTSTIASGFGNMMTSIGLPVGFGTILGQLMNDSGAAEVIADKIVSAFPAKKAIWGLSIAGFILSIPVFFDVTFIILIPIGITIASKIDLKMGYVTGDGKAIAVDGLTILKHKLKKIELEELYLKAADTTNDGTISSADSLAIIKDSIGTSMIHL